MGPGDQTETGEKFGRLPFYRYLPVPWTFHSDELVYSLTHSHGLKTKIHFHNLSDPVNANRPERDHVLLSYEVMGRHYDLYTLADMHKATYAFDDTGFSNMKGDLAERVARRIMKRFLQRFDQNHGRLGGLFDKRFNPKNSENYVVANTRRYILKIGSYPNMILLKKTGSGKWGYQHVTDLDGLFDYRWMRRRHLIIIESKIGKIDINAGALYETLFVPLKKLFPDADFSYVVFASRDYLLDNRYPEYRLLQETPQRIYQALKDAGIPSFFFEFRENDNEFDAMCRHLITTHRTYHGQQVTFQGRVTITDKSIQIFNPGSTQPYMELRRDAGEEDFKVIQSAQFSREAELGF